MLDAWETIRAPRSVIAYNGNNMQKQKNQNRRDEQGRPFQTQNTHIPVDNNEDD